MKRCHLCIDGRASVNRIHSLVHCNNLNPIKLLGVNVCVFQSNHWIESIHSRRVAFNFFKWRSLSWSSGHWNGLWIEVTIPLALREREKSCELSRSFAIALVNNVNQWSSHPLYHSFLLPATIDFLVPRKSYCHSRRNHIQINRHNNKHNNACTKKTKANDAYAHSEFAISGTQDARYWFCVSKGPPLPSLYVCSRGGTHWHVHRAKSGKLVGTHQYSGLKK